MLLLLATFDKFVALPSNPPTVLAKPPLAKVAPNVAPPEATAAPEAAVAAPNLTPPRINWVAFLNPKLDTFISKTSPINLLIDFVA